ncbi:unnamed protein product, partial [Choristocarpus tenellus]
CSITGRVESWNPPTSSDLRSIYRWQDERKVCPYSLHF